MEPNQAWPMWVNLVMLVLATISGGFGTFIYNWWRTAKTENKENKRIDNEHELAEANLAFSIYRDLIEKLQKENTDLKATIVCLRKELDEVKEKLYKIESCATVKTELENGCDK